MTPPPAGPVAAAARLTWGALAGPALDDGDRARLGAGLGGVVLFERNIVSAEQLRALTADIRRLAAGSVRISLDQEGGHVIRVGAPDATRFPGPMAIAAAGSTRLARQVAAASARELRSLGVDTVLAPVLDVAVVPESAAIGARAFGDTARIVGRLGAAMVRGYLEGGVLPVPKHFPGHGRTAEDSHVARAAIRGSLATLERTDLPPFAMAVAAGAPALMTGHVVVEALDARRPASLSAAAATLARERLGFDGMLVTDALVMDAIAHRLALEEAGAAAIAAGMDAAMAIEGQRRVLDGLATAIADGRLAEARVRDALARASALARAADALRGLPLGVPLPDARVEGHRWLARTVAERSLTLVSDVTAVLPLDASAAILVVDVEAETRSPIEGTAGTTAADGGAGERLAAAFPRARVMRISTGRAADAAASAAMADTALGAAAGADAVVLLTRDGFAGPMAALPGSLAAAGRPLVHVALRNPLDLAGPAGSGRPAARVAAYADTEPTIDALSLALLGRIPFRGQLPVRLPATLPGDETVEVPA